MFRFDNFRKSSIASAEGHAAEDDSLIATDGSSDSQLPPSFLQRIASTEALFRPSPKKRPSTSSLQQSSSFTQQASSFSIPIPTNSWGMRALSQLQDPDNNEYDDIIDLLMDGNRAVLLLAVSRPTHPSVHIDLEFIKDHVIVYPHHHQNEFQVVSLSGIRGVFQKDQFVVLDFISTECDITSLLRKRDDVKSPFATFALDPSSITSDYPVYNILATHVPVKIRDGKVIHAMLIQKPLSKSDVMEWMKNRSIIQHTTSELQPITTPLSITSLDDPLAQRVNTFINNYRLRSPKTPTMASSQWADFLDDLRDAMDSDSNAGNVNDRLDGIESYMCHQLYDRLSKVASSDDSLQDEVLQSRIAAANLLGLNLSHLGVMVEASESESINEMVKLAGAELQQLHLTKGAKEKLDVLVKTHQIIVDGIEQCATRNKETTVNSDLEVVQEMKQAMSIVNDEVIKQETEEKINANELDTGNDSTIEAQRQLQHDSDPISNDTEAGGKQITTSSTASTDSSTSVTREQEKKPSKLSTANADVLLPLLIYTIVKCNPTNFMSNLKFIQRFRHPSRLSGQASYCLTNILAAVAFLETTNLMVLGLSADKVHSNVTDLNAIMPTQPATEPVNHHGEILTTASGAGLKLVSEVMDSSYRVFDGIGRFWQQRGGNDIDGPTTSSSSMSVSAAVENSMSAPTSGSSGSMKQNLERPALSPSELKDMASSVMGFSKLKRDSTPNASLQHDGGLRGENAIPGFLEQRKLSLKPSASSSTSSSSSRTDSFQALLQAPSQFIQSVQQKSSKHIHPNQYDEPIQKFMTMKSVDDMTIGEVSELLADYKRLAAILKQANVSQLRH